MSAFRPRSRSSDSPVKSPHSFDIYSLSGAKRGHSQVPSPTSDDVGLRKKRRRDYAHSMSEPLNDARESSAYSAENSLVSKSVFATNSAQFNLFPRQTHRSNTSRHLSFEEPWMSPSRSPSHLDELTKLRSTAFWELRQSVAENGQGLVQRMREYERYRSRQQAQQRARDSERRGRKRSAWRTRHRALLQPSSEASDEEDISSFRGFSSSSDGRAIVRPAESMDVDSDDASHEEQNYASSAIPSSHAQDDEDDDPIFIDTSCAIGIADDSRSDAPDLNSSPSTSYSSTGSPCSSVISLLLPPTSEPSQSAPSQPSPQSALEGHIYPSTSSEKALAALSIALANGAGSISDYSPVWEYQRRFNVEGIDHGDLWR